MEFESINLVQYKHKNTDLKWTYVKLTFLGR